MKDKHDTLTHEMIFPIDDIQQPISFDKARSEGFSEGYGMCLFTTPSRHGYTGVNPYKKGTGEWAAWEAGYEDGEHEGFHDKMESME